jgi:hypothetical protein
LRVIITNDYDEMSCRAANIVIDEEASSELKRADYYEHVEVMERKLKRPPFSHWEVF